jgi:hypothetical protein
MAKTDIAALVAAEVDRRMGVVKTVLDCACTTVEMNIQKSARAGEQGEAEMLKSVLVAVKFVADALSHVTKCTAPLTDDITAEDWRDMSLDEKIKHVVEWDSQRHGRKS